MYVCIYIYMYMYIYICICIYITYMVAPPQPAGSTFNVISMVFTVSCCFMIIFGSCF